MTVLGSRVCVAAVAVALAAAACPARRAPGPPDIRSGERPRVGGVLSVILVEDVDSLDPHRATRPSSWFFARALHRGLLAYPGEVGRTEPVPDLATVEASADRSRYVVRLRPGSRFANARRAVDARDVKASLERLLRARVGIAPYLQVISGAPAYVAGRARGVSGIRVTGPTSLRIRVRERVNDFLALLAHPQAAILPAGTPARGVFPRSLDGAGPYRIRSYEPERSIRLLRNTQWDEAADDVRGAYVDEIRARMGVTLSTAYARVARGDADVVVEPGPPDAGVSVTGAEASRVERVGGTCVRYLALNPLARPFRTRAARLAVAHAVERARIAGGGESLVAPRILPRAVEGHSTRPVLPESVARARAAARAARLADGFAFRLTILRAERDRAEAVALARSLARIGIRVVRRELTPAAFAAPGAGLASAPAVLATWCADWSGPAGRSMLGGLAGQPRTWSAPTPRPAGRRGAAIRRALARAAIAPPERADDLWEAADALVVADATIVPLTWPLEVVPLSSRVRGWTGAPMWPRGDPTSIWIAG